MVLTLQTLHLSEREQGVAKKVYLCTMSKDLWEAVVGAVGGMGGGRSGWSELWEWPVLSSPGAQVMGALGAVGLLCTFQLLDSKIL